MRENEAKRLFMAQYLGKPLYGYGKNPFQKLFGVTLDRIWLRHYPFKDSPDTWRFILGECLLLRSIEDLTDIELLIIAQIFDLSEEQINDTDLQEWVEAIFTETAGYYIDGYTGSQLLKLVDYLRSIGTLLPFTFLDETNTPITLNPAQLIERGWVKLLKP